MTSVRPSTSAPEAPQATSRVIPTLTGPTGVGKTALSIALAVRLDAEIVSVDSRQIYRQLTVGAAKPDPDQLATIPHHFIDELSLEQPSSSGRYAVAARRRIREILSRGKTPLVVGGSTLYLQALQYGLADVPDVPAAVRSDLMHRLEREGAESLYKELRNVDPASAARMDSTKTQRLIRALEVFHGTGKPFSTYRMQAVIPPPLTFQTVVLWRDRRDLYDRIDRRVDAMLAGGLVEEVRGILDAGFDPGLNALRTIGYRETLRYIDQAIDHDRMRELIKRNTRRYAKRQLTWFRRFADYHWISAAASPDAVLRVFASNDASLPGGEDSSGTRSKK